MHRLARSAVEHLTGAKPEFGYWDGSVDGGGGAWDDVVARVYRKHLTETLGWPERDVEEFVALDVAASREEALVRQLETAGWDFRGKTLLEVGCGTGPFLRAVLGRPSMVLGVEPSPVFAAVARGRLAGAAGLGKGHLLAADGGRLPLPDACVDFVVSLQVLEHVEDPEPFVREVARVLKPGGRAFLSYENYLSFWEPHYRVVWLPWLPKPLARLYLRLRGRDTRFLDENIYYRTGFGMSRLMRRAGLVSETWERTAEKFRHPERFRNPVFRVLAAVVGRLVPRGKHLTAALYLTELWQVLRVTHAHFLRKPERPPIS